MNQITEQHEVPGNHTGAHVTTLPRRYTTMGITSEEDLFKKYYRKNSISYRKCRLKKRVRKVYFSSARAKHGSADSDKNVA